MILIFLFLILNGGKSALYPYVALYFKIFTFRNNFTVVNCFLKFKILLGKCVDGEAYLGKNVCNKNYLIFLVYLENKCQICLFSLPCFYLKSNLLGLFNTILYNFMFL